MKRILLVLLVLFLAILACNGGDSSGELVETVEEKMVEVNTVEPTLTDTQDHDKSMETELPVPTEWIVFVECPECEGLPLALWEHVDDMGKSPGKVNHGDMCVVVEVGSYEGVERYKINCVGMVGWLRAEGLVNTR